ncbi:hypothetical protein V8B55DRAFT_1532954 [Mucor lusitanicus]
MLNPLAHDFTPIAAFSPEAPSSQQLKSPPPPKRKEEQPSKKKQAKAKTLAATTNTSSTSTSTAKGKRKIRRRTPKSSSSSSNNTSKHRPTKTTQAIHTTPTTPSDLFAKESKFITIEAAIDPIRRIKETSHANSLQNRRQSTHHDTYQVEHGYEQYIDWIDRSLRLFDTVTLVGMDNAVVDIVSLVTILQDRRIGVHDDVETFSMDIGNSRITACIQVKLHSFY